MSGGWGISPVDHGHGQRSVLTCCNRDDPIELMLLLLLLLFFSQRSDAVATGSDNSYLRRRTRTLLLSSWLRRHWRCNGSSCRRCAWINDVGSTVVVVIIVCGRLRRRVYIGFCFWVDVHLLEMTWHCHRYFILIVILLKLFCGHGRQLVNCFDFIIHHFLSFFFSLKMYLLYYSSVWWLSSYGRHVYWSIVKLAQFFCELIFLVFFFFF